MTGPGDYVLSNRAAWDQLASDYAEEGRHGWATEPSWGIWSVPEAQAGILPAALAVAPNQSFLVVATHGRGMWKLAG